VELYLKCFLDGFHNDDVFITVPEINGLEDPELWKMDIVLGTQIGTFVLMLISN
jgi:hypothetical protein